METMLLMLGLVILLVNVAVVAGAMWVGYRLVVSAVRTAILEADEERARRAYSSDINR